MSRQKTDYPALLMVKRGGGFFPATPSDAERVDTYREGDQFWMTITTKGVHWRIRQCKAVIRYAVKNCKTPWHDADSADAALKLAVGHVAPYQNVLGDWEAVPKSMNDCEDDAELESLCERIYALLYEITGVEVETLYRESRAPMGPEETSSVAPPADDEPAGVSPNLSTPAGDPHEDDEPETQSDVEQRLGGKSEPITADSIILHFFRYVAARVSSGEVTPDYVEENVDTLNMMAKNYGEAFSGLSSEDKERVKTCKGLLVNFVSLKAGFEYPSVRRRVSEASGLSVDQLEDL